MKAVNELKPINVLVRFITAWVNDHAANALPFNSFETDVRTIEQKDVERWVLNCNYTYYRLGNLLFEQDLIPDDAAKYDALFAHLETHVKSIRDSNPLKLRSKQPDALASELSKDWPPYTAHSRNNIERALLSLGQCANAFEGLDPRFSGIVRAFAQELTEEARWYRQLERRAPGIEGVAERCRTLVPLWCLKEINPLFSLLIWQDERGIDELAQQLSDAFVAGGYPSFDGGSRHDAYRGAVRLSQRYYLEGLASATAGNLQARPVPELSRMLQSEFFNLEHPVPSTTFPSWLFGKSLLIWNVVICSILGPRAAIRPVSSNRTATQLGASTLRHAEPALRGEVLLRRKFRSGELETVTSATFEGGSAATGKRPSGAGRKNAPSGAAALVENTSAPEIWCVLGSRYDEHARIPEMLSAAEAWPSDIFVETSTFDEQGNQVEGIGDSRYHAVLYIERQSQGDCLMVRDLGSKNGTYVVRAHQKATRYFVLTHRTTTTADAWAQRMHVPADAVCIVESLPLERGDCIQLCGSCFEIA